MKKRTVKAIAIALAVISVTAVLLFAFEKTFGKRKSPDDFTASANSYVGSFGENIKWSLNTQTGALEISGSGEIPECDSPENVPWSAYSKYIKTATVEAGITQISPYLFYKAKGLTYVSIPRSVKAIGKYAFYACNSLLEVGFAENSRLEKIDEAAFAYCRSLESFDMPTRVDSIGKNAFLCCYSLNNITLAYSVKSVGEGAFSSCSNLKSVKIVNYDCDIFDDGETFYTNTELVCFKNSTAKSYADKYLRTYSVIKDMKNINDMTVKLSFDECVYNEKKRKPEVKIKGLKQGKDYTVSYGNNKSPGIASVTVSAAGSTLGEVTLNFTIKPQKPEGLRVRRSETDEIELTWNEVYGADGYEVYRLVGKEWKKAAQNESNKVKIKKLDEASEYTFKVRAFVKTDSGKIKSKFSRELKCATAPDKVKITSVVNRGIGRLTVHWNRVSGADGYIIYVSNKKNGTYKQAAVVNYGSRTSYSVLNLKSNEKYFVKMKAFVKVGDAKYLGDDSNTVSKSPM